MGSSAPLLGPVGRPLEIPLGAQAIVLNVMAPGFKAEVAEVVPDKDQTVSVELKPLAPKLNKDLEDPF